MSILKDNGLDIAQEKGAIDLLLDIYTINKKYQKIFFNGVITGRYSKCQGVPMNLAYDAKIYKVDDLLQKFLKNKYNHDKIYYNL